MLVKYFSSKKGGGVESIDYLLNKKRTQQGTARILKGDENLTRNLINSMHQKHKACVGCLSFEERNIDENLKKEIMQSFENMLLTQEMAERYNILWVEHIDKGRLELNFVIPKIDLESKKAFNPYFHMADYKRNDLWTDFVNLKHNLSNPKDPAKAQTLQGSRKEKRLVKDYEALDKLLQEKVLQGEISSRADIISLLKSHNIEVTRQGKDYLGIKLPNHTKAKRFKGGIYDEQFTNFESIKGIYREQSEREREYNQRDNKTLLAELDKQLNERIQAKARFYAERNQRVSRKDIERSSIENEPSTEQNTREFERIQHRANQIETKNPSNDFSSRNANDDDFVLDCVVSVDKTLSSIQKPNARVQHRENLHRHEQNRNTEAQRHDLHTHQVRSDDDSTRERINQRSREIAERNNSIAGQRTRAIQVFNKSINDFKDYNTEQQGFNANSLSRARAIQAEFAESRERISSSFRNSQTAISDTKQRANTIRTSIQRTRDTIAGISKRLSGEFAELTERFTNAIRQRIKKIILERERKRERNRGLSR